MKYIMQDYNKLAYVLDQPREFRERILTMKAGKDHLKYLINLVDLLATCAEVSRTNHTYIDIPGYPGKQEKLQWKIICRVCSEFENVDIPGTENIKHYSLLR